MRLASEAGRRQLVHLIEAGEVVSGLWRQRILRHGFSLTRSSFQIRSESERRGYTDQLFKQVSEVQVRRLAARGQRECEILANDSRWGRVRAIPSRPGDTLRALTCYSNSDRRSFSDKTVSAAIPATLLPFGSSFGL